MINPLKKAVRGALAGAGGVTSLLSSAGAIYWREAAQGATMPYIIYDLAGGGDTNDTPRDMLDVRVTVRAVSQSSTTAGSIAGAVRDALHRQALTFDDGWKHIACQHSVVIDYEERVEGQQFYHAGGTYRIRASK